MKFVFGTFTSWQAKGSQSVLYLIAKEILACEYGALITKNCFI